MRLNGKHGAGFRTPAIVGGGSGHARRPDMQSAYAAQKASLANVRAAKAEFLPKFFMSANGTYSSGYLNVTSLPSGGQQPPTVNISGNHLGGSIFARVTIPLYDGGTRDAQLDRARAEADNADARLTQVREDAVRQIVLADTRTMHGHSSRFTIAAAAVASARNLLDPIAVFVNQPKPSCTIGSAKRCRLACSTDRARPPSAPRRRDVEPSESCLPTIFNVRPRARVVAARDRFSRSSAVPKQLERSGRHHPT